MQPPIDLWFGQVRFATYQAILLWEKLEIWPQTKLCIILFNRGKNWKHYRNVERCAYWKIWQESKTCIFICHETNIICITNRSNIFWCLIVMSETSMLHKLWKDQKSNLVSKNREAIWNAHNKLIKDVSVPHGDDSSL